jgi:hypothetical protein
MTTFPFQFERIHQEVLAFIFTPEQARNSSSLDRILDGLPRPSLFRPRRRSSPAEAGRKIFQLADAIVDRFRWPRRCGNQLILAPGI